MTMENILEAAALRDIQDLQEASQKQARRIELLERRVETNEQFVQKVAATAQTLMMAGGFLMSVLTCAALFARFFI